jgi:hypothetical protein
MSKELKETKKAKPQKKGIVPKTLPDGRVVEMKGIRIHRVISDPKYPHIKLPDHPTQWYETDLRNLLRAKHGIR